MNITYLALNTLNKCHVLWMHNNVPSTEHSGVLNRAVSFPMGYLKRGYCRLWIIIFASALRVMCTTTYTYTGAHKRGDHRCLSHTLPQIRLVAKAYIAYHQIDECIHLIETMPRMRGTIGTVPIVFYASCLSCEIGAGICVLVSCAALRRITGRW